MRVLVVEDDQVLSKNVSEALTAEGMNTQVVYDGLLADRLLKREHFDCVIMDVNMPGMSGFDLCKSFRQVNTTTPVIMLTAFCELEDKVRGFDCGADDYLTKPFYMRELVLRIRSLVKRINSNGTPMSAVVSAGDIVLDDSKKTVSRQGQNISLTQREFQILRTLMKRKGEVVSKAELVEQIWGSAFGTNTNTIEVYINFLRNKIDRPFQTQLIKTKVGFGYFLDAE